MDQVTNEITDIIEQFRHFKIESEKDTIKRNIWLSTENINIYIRKQLLPNENDRSTYKYHLCIASVSINEHYQNKSIFTTLLRAFEEEIGHFKSIEFECVNNRALENLLRKYNYQDSIRSCNDTPCLIKHIG